MSHRCLIVFLFSLGLAGCSPLNRTNEAPINTDAPGIADQMGRASLSQARFLFQQKRYQQALLEYRKVLETTGSDLESQQARLGTGRCLLKMDQYPAAIAAMKPLPLKPATEVDC